MSPTQSATFSGGTASVGGQLYDTWWVVNNGAIPTTTHPAYPSLGQQPPDVTWRCKECHGWDYMGVDGAYGTGSHFTGIGGVFQGRGQSSLVLGNQIKSGPDHDFGMVLSDQDISHLVAFIQQGTIDMNQSIEFGTRQALGDSENGRLVWARTCGDLLCHGDDGLANPADVPAEARDNPWETLHKIRWGHPGSDMPSQVVEGLTTQEQVDVLTYAQTL